MSNLEKFKPDWMLESFRSITADELKEHQVHGLITDLDNTLIAWNKPDSSMIAEQWVEHLRNHGIHLVILSNNKADRIRPVAEKLGVNFIARGLKPLSYNFNRAVDLLGVEKKHTLMLGDQLLTDVLGANMAGIRSALVKPIVQTDGILTQWNRKIESRLMERLMGQDNKMKWRQSLSERS